LRSRQDGKIKAAKERKRLHKPPTCDVKRIGIRKHVPSKLCRCRGPEHHALPGRPSTRTARATAQVRGTQAVSKLSVRDASLPTRALACTQARPYLLSRAYARHKVRTSRQGRSKLRLCWDRAPNTSVAEASGAGGARAAFGSRLPLGFLLLSHARSRAAFSREKPSERRMEESMEVETLVWRRSMEVERTTPHQCRRKN